MSTKALIGQIGEHGQVATIEVTYDGGLDHTGTLLHYLWQEPTEIAKLIAGGNITVLGLNMGTKHNGFSAPPDPDHLEDTIFVIRDRQGEPETYGAKTFPNLGNFWVAGQDDERPTWSHLYCHDGKEWLHAQPGCLTSAPLAEHLGSVEIAMEIKSDSDGRYIAIELMPDIGSDGAHGSLHDLMAFFDTTGEWYWSFSRMDNPRARFASENSLVAVGLRYNLVVGD